MRVGEEDIATVEYERHVIKKVFFEVLGKLILYAQDTGHSSSIYTSVPSDSGQFKMSDSLNHAVRTLTLLQVSGKKANQVFHKKRCEKAKTPILHREEANLSQKDLKKDVAESNRNEEAGHDDQLH